MTPARFNFARDVVEAQDPARPALRFCDRSGAVRDLTFGEVADAAARWTGLLRAREVTPGDRVLVLVGKTPDWFSVMLAVLKTGAVAIPCSEMLRAKDLDFRVRHSGARLLVADASSREEIGAMAESPAVVYLADVPGADKLVMLRVSFGDHERTIVSGMKAERMNPREIEGRQALFVVNLKPRKMKGILSEGMVFDIGYADGVVPVLAVPEGAVPDGARAG